MNKNSLPDREIAVQRGYGEFKTAFCTRDSYRAISETLTNIIGPHTVKERWDLLGEHGLEFTRKIHNLEGAPLTVALNLVFSLQQEGYPSDVLLISMIQDLGGKLDEKLTTSVNRIVGG